MASQQSGVLTVTIRRRIRNYRVYKGRISVPVAPSMRWMTQRDIDELLNELTARGYEASFEEHK
jgi:hypothetical protein